MKDKGADSTFLLLPNPFSARGAVCPGVIELVDVFPTLAELAGLRVPSKVEGTSFAPLIQDPNRVWNQVAYTESDEGRNQSVCNGRFRYTQWADGTIELYDHDKDPGEWYDQSDNPAYSVTIAKLEAKLVPRP